MKKAKIRRRRPQSDTKETTVRCNRDMNPLLLRQWLSTMFFFFALHFKSQSIFFSNMNVAISNHRCLIICCIQYTVCALPLVYSMFPRRTRRGVCVKTLHSQSESPAARAGGSSDALLQHASSSSKKFPHNILLPGKTRRGSERRVFAPEILRRARNQQGFSFFRWFSLTA